MMQHDEALQCPLGVALCVVEIYDCIDTEEFHGPTARPISEGEAAWGNYRCGRYAWLTRNNRRLSKPVPVIGRQGIFSLSLQASHRVLRQLP
jgi:activating signal cointegrator 1